MSKGLTSNKSTNININYMLSQFRCYVLIEFEFYQDQKSPSGLFPIRHPLLVLRLSNLELCYTYIRGVVPGDARGAMALPDFGRSVNPISIKGGRLCLPNNTGISGFSDLPIALYNNVHT